MNQTEIQQRIDNVRNRQLTTLDLSNCALTHIPAEVFELNQLTELKLGHWSDYNKQQRNRITHLPADLVRLNNLQHLDISSNELSDLPPEIAQLPQLLSLDLSNNQFEQLPDAIGDVTHLQLLDVSNNQLVEIAPALTRLHQLQRLNLSKNLLRQIPPDFALFSSLQRLDLSHNYLDHFPLTLATLHRLQQLSLIGNQISELPPEIAALQNLRIFYINNNQLSALPHEFGQLKQLQRVYMSSNVLNDFPEALLAIETLQLLDLRNNHIGRLPAELSRLKRLEYLDIAQNRIAELPPQIAEINELQLLDLRSNRIAELPPDIARMPNLQYLYINDNPIESPPPEVAARGLSAIRTYFREMEKASEKDYLYEIKLLLVGEGRVGKTSLAKSLTIPDYELEDQQSTEGIDIQTWVVPKNELELSKDFRLNVWDFGGQEIYHATHQFFLTKRSIYILVTESRKEDKHEDFYYWLNIIRILGDRSPVIIVLNKCDQPTKELPIKEYRKTFDNIVAFSTISCQPDYRHTIINLKRKLRQVIMNRDLLPHLGTALPKVWIAIRAELEELREQNIDYISFKDYLKICKKHYQDEETALFLSAFFHDLGVILHFTDDPDLKETIFLNHDWVTKGVYNVLDNQRVKSKQGNFTDNDLAYIWQDSKYKEQRRALLALMKNNKFELCFELKPGHYLAPQLLPVDEIDYEWNSEVPQTRFEYRYQFMPKGILTRFIVKRHRDIYEGQNWRYGVLLQRDNTRALVREMYFDRKISITIEGEYPQALLELVRDTIDDINHSFNSLQVSEMLHCSCSECSHSHNPHFYRLELLKKYEQFGKIAIDCEKSLESVSVRMMLDQIRRPQPNVSNSALSRDEQSFDFPMPMAATSDHSKEKSDQLPANETPANPNSDYVQTHYADQMMHEMPLYADQTTETQMQIETNKQEPVSVTPPPQLPLDNDAQPVSKSNKNVLVATITIVLVLTLIALLAWFWWLNSYNY
jgi:small GTP-binding protein